MADCPADVADSPYHAKFLLAQERRSFHFGAECLVNASSRVVALAIVLVGTGCSTPKASEEGTPRAHALAAATSSVSLGAIWVLRHSSDTTPPPENLVIGGKESVGNGGAGLPICRGTAGSGVHPGKVVNGKCNVAYGGGEVPLDDYELLTGSNDCRLWKSYGGSPAEADFSSFLRAGHENNEHIYVCRLPEGIVAGYGQQPGKLVVSGAGEGRKRSCHFGFKEKEEIATPFDACEHC